MISGNIINNYHLIVVNGMPSITMEENINGPDSLPTVRQNSHQTAKRAKIFP